MLAVQCPNSGQKRTYNQVVQSGRSVALFTFTVTNDRKTARTVERTIQQWSLACTDKVAEARQCGLTFRSSMTMGIVEVPRLSIWDAEW